MSHRLLCGRLRGAGVGVRGHAVLGEDGFKLLQCGVRSHPRRVKVSPTHPEAGLGQVVEEFVQPVQTKSGIKSDALSSALRAKRLTDHCSALWDFSSTSSCTVTYFGMFMPLMLWRWML